MIHTRTQLECFRFIILRLMEKLKNKWKTCVGVLLYYKDTPRARTIFIEHLQVIFSHITKVAAGIL